MDPLTKRYDRLSPDQRRKAERLSERKAFGPAGNAMSTALISAIEQRHDTLDHHRQGNVSTQPAEANHGNPAALCRKAMRAGR